MGGIVLAVLGVGITPGQAPPAEEIGSYIYQPSYELDFLLRGPPVPYLPQPGDIVFSTDRSRFWKLMHNLAGSGHPTHSMVVFQRRDGTMAILEAGPHDTLRIRTLDAIPHLKSYEDEGRVWVRRRTVPLTPEQSARLTEFAELTDLKRFAFGRLGVQLTPFRPRGPVKTYFMGKPNGPGRSAYYCAELAIEALVYACLLDPETARPSATYPRDFFLDRSLNHYLNEHLHLYPCWELPQRWKSCPVEGGTVGK
jgi:hypothetical protein